MAKHDRIWDVALDTQNMRVKFITRSDGKVRSEYPLAGVDESLHDYMALKGLAKLLEERTSQVSKSDIKATCRARDEYMDLFHQGKLKAPKTGSGPHDVPVEVEAVQALKGFATIGETQKWLRAVESASPGARKAILTGSKVKAKAAAILAERDPQEVQDLGFDDLVDDK